MTLLETYDGVTIVSTPDTLGGSPRLAGHRIGVHHLADLAKTDDVATARERYPHLHEAQIRAAFRYASDHREVYREHERVREELRRYMDAREHHCRCGEPFVSIKRIRKHLERELDGAVDESSDHALANSTFSGTLVCLCGEEFTDIGPFLRHRYAEDGWPPRSDHGLQLIE